MAISYTRLWKLLIDRGMNRLQLRDAAGVSTNAIAKFGRNEPVSMEALEKVCVALDCNIEDMVGFLKNGEVLSNG